MFSARRDPVRVQSANCLLQATKARPKIPGATTRTRGAVEVVNEAEAQPMQAKKGKAEGRSQHRAKESKPEAEIKHEVAMEAMQCRARVLGMLDMAAWTVTVSGMTVPMVSLAAGGLSVIGFFNGDTHAAESRSALD
jgi:hypothetical protein